MDTGSYAISKSNSLPATAPSTAFKTDYYAPEELCTRIRPKPPNASTIYRTKGFRDQPPLFLLRSRGGKKTRTSPPFTPLPSPDRLCSLSTHTAQVLSLNRSTSPTFEAQRLISKHGKEKEVVARGLAQDRGHASVPATMSDIWDHTSHPRNDA